jgi:hypothetical protein
MFFEENMVGAVPFHYRRNSKWYSYKPGRTGQQGYFSELSIQQVVICMPVSTL